MKQEDTVTTITKTITYQQAQQIIDIACSEWKDTLFEKWGKDIILKRSIVISQEFYDQMRKACTASQHKLFDEIFGKDKPEYKVGDWVTWSGKTPITAQIIRQSGSIGGPCWVLNEETHNSCHESYLRLATPEEIEAAKFPSKGTPCLVRDHNAQTWRLVYSNGDGKFTSAASYKEIHSWEQYQILDINNLPTQ